MSLFSDRLVYARKKSGFTQQDIAVHFNLTRSAYSAWEVGRNEPSFEILAQLCKKLEVSADYLIGLTDSISPAAVTPVSIAPVSIPRSDTNPLEELDPDLRSKAEGYIDSLLEQQKERASLPKGQEG